MTVSAFAPAKLNLTLHVTGRRADGYHLLDSLVVFADIGDRVTARPSDTLTLDIDGPQAGALSGEGDNLVLRAARALSPGRGAAICLEKHLPVASGIGGGSADAAAALQALAALWQVPLPDAETVLALGADVPACLAAHPVRMQGIGERLTPLGPMPALSVVLVNPGKAVSTPAVFRALASRDNPPMPALPARFDDAASLVGWLRQTRNDLEAPARDLVPEIGKALQALAATEGCLMARMSGSGATCFGLYATPAAAQAAAATLGAEPGWWVACGRLLAGPAAV